jgi:hypothetical protein
MSPPDPDDDGRETLQEAITDALAASLGRALQHTSDPEKVRRAFRDLTSMTHATLYDLVGPGTHDAGVSAWLQRPTLVAKQHGRMIWDQDLLAQDMEAERLGQHLPRARGAPRLFLSYSWTHDDDIIFWVEEFAGWLFNRGYDIVFDRDPRHAAKGFTSDDVLVLLAGCSQMIAIVTDGYQERISDPKLTSPACQEFALAPMLYRLNKQPTLLGLWVQGERLEPPFSERWVKDARDEDLYLAKRDAWFPPRRYQVACMGTDAAVRELGPMPRVDVRQTVHRLLTEKPGQRVAIRDVTSAT